MKNKIVGVLVIGIAVLIGIIIYFFNKALTKIVATSCTHGTSCPMWGTLNFQTNVSIGVMAFVVLIGLYLIFFAKEEKIVTRFKTLKAQVELKKITKESYKKAMAGLDKDERAVVEQLIETEGSAFQSELVSKTELGKVKVTRVLDKLEGKGLIERKRRGMTNIVLLK
jgi:uncharacterized membrane protein